MRKVEPSFSDLLALHDPITGYDISVLRGDEITSAAIKKLVKSPMETVPVQK